MTARRGGEADRLRAGLVWRGASIRGALVLTGKLAVLGTTVVATRLMSSIAAGQLFAGLAASVLIAGAMALGLPEAVSRSLGRAQALDRDERARGGEFIIAALGLWCVGASVGLVVCSAAVTALGIPLAAIPLAATVLGALVGLNTVLAACMRVRGHAVVAELGATLGSIVFVAVLFGVARSQRLSGVDALWLRCATELAVAASVASLTLWRDRRSARGGLAYASLRSVMGQALPLGLTSFSWFAQQNVGIVLLALLSGPVPVAHYQPLLKIADVAGGVASMFGPYLLPVVARLRGADDLAQINSLYVQASRAAFALSAPILAALLFDSHAIASKFFGFAHGHTASVAAVLVSAYVLNAALGFNGVLLEAVGALRTLAVRSATVVAVVVIANGALIAGFGAIGAAVGLLVGYLAVNGLNSILLHHATGITPLQRRLLEPLAATLLATLAAAGLSAALAGPTAVVCPIVAALTPLAIVFAPLIRGWHPSRLGPVA